MRKKIRAVWAVAMLGAVLCGGGAKAQMATVEQSTNDALRTMTEMAGVIFTGQVTAVRRHAGADGAAGVVEIQFAVENAIRGVSGGSYTVREWAGLWPGDDEPFRVGQQYLMLLHTPSAAGLSSPVGGMDGAIPIRGKGAAQGRVVDMSWVGTHVVRPVVYQHTMTQGPVGGPISVQAKVAGTGSGEGSGAAAEAMPVPEQESAGYGAVIGMLQSWEVERNGAR